MLAHPRNFLVAVFIFCILICFLTIFDFLCLHDINKDYVSRFVFQYLKIDLPKGLPEWTLTKSEWQLVTISYLLRVIFLILNLITLAFCIRKFRET